MAPTSTQIFRVSLPRTAKIYRDIEIASSASLHDLASAIVKAFDFTFDHAFGFYSGKTPATLMRKAPKYELFADLDGTDTDAQSVKRTTVATAFPKPRHQITFLFDYGDNWLFNVILTGTGQKAPKTRYPKVLATQGKSPTQYPDPNDPDEE
jgi:Plasmid pRiA4b ORF-3-like protein